MSAVDRRIHAFAAARHFVLGHAELAELGVSREAVRVRVADGRLHRLHRGVFAVGRRPINQLGRWRAAVLAYAPDTFLSHCSAAALRDLTEARRPVDLIASRPGLRSRKGMRIHHASLTPFEADEVDGIPVTSLARTLLDVAATEDELTLRRVYERAERLQILDLTPIRQLLSLRRGHRGAGRLRALITYDPTAAAAAISELERLYLDLLRDFGLPTPQVNVLVDGYLVDCYWPEADVVVELDSYEFHGDREAFERDRAKLANLRRARHEAVQFTYRQVTARRDWVAETTGHLIAAARPQRSL